MANTETTTSVDPKKMTIRNFKASDDVETFYRFIYENDLRREAKQALAFVQENVKARRPRGRKRGRKKLQ